MNVVWREREREEREGEICKRERDNRGGERRERVECEREKREC